MKLTIANCLALYLVEFHLHLKDCIVLSQLLLDLKWSSKFPVLWMLVFLCRQISLSLAHVDYVVF